jgi:putative DNA primase/helicase
MTTTRCGISAMTTTRCGISAMTTKRRRISRAEEKLPVIRVDAGEIARAADEASAALAARPSDLYQRGGLVVHPVLRPVAAADGRETRSHQVIIADEAYVGEAVTRAARVEAFDARRGAYVPKHCPALLIKTLLGRGQYPFLRVLNRVIVAPTLRPDGSILERPGYDEVTGLLYDPGGREFPLVPASPTRNDASAALGLYRGIFKTFPFVSDADLAVAIAGVLTALVRPSLTAAPLFAFTAPAAGSGKTLIVDGTSLIATGRIAAVISQGDTEQELEKRFGACLIAGDAFVVLDNCERPVGGPIVCQALTQQTLKTRLLGESVNIEVPCSATVFATGNNLIVSGDVTRRALLCSLDAQCERPELRVFDTDFLELVRAKRNELVIAGLTIMRAHVVTGAPSASPPIGSFTDWCRLVRDALVWCGMSDPCETMAKTRAADPRFAALAAVVDQWESVIGDATRKSAAELIKLVSDRDEGSPSRPFMWPDFRDALLVVAGTTASTIDARRLGKWLAAVHGRIVGGRRIVKDGTHAGVVRWRLDLVEREP